MFTGRTVNATKAETSTVDVYRQDSKRYESSDLYKPRMSYGGGSRRRRASPSPPPPVAPPTPRTGAGSRKDEPIIVQDDDDNRTPRAPAAGRRQPRQESRDTMTSSAFR